MQAYSRSFLISAVPRNEQLRGEKRAVAKFQIDFSKTDPNFIGYLRFPFSCYKLVANLIYPVQGIINFGSDNTVIKN